MSEAREQKRLKKQSEDRCAFWRRLLELLRARDLITLENTILQKLLRAETEKVSAKAALAAMPVAPEPPKPRELAPGERAAQQKHEEALLKVKWD